MARTLLRPAQKTELTSILTKKAEMKSEMFPQIKKKDYPVTILLHIADEVCRGALYQFCTVLGYHVVLSQESDLKKWDLYAFDLFVTDDTEGKSLSSLFRHGVVCVLPSDHAYSGVLSDFHPLTFEGNAYLTRGSEAVFYLERIVLARENLSYPGDRKILLENIYATFED